MKRLWMGAVLLGVSAGASAAPGLNFVDGYFVPSAEVEFDNAGPLIDGTEDGDGFGARAALQFAPSLFVTGEYTANEYDNEAELDTVRVGLGLGEGAGTGDGLYARIEYLNADDGVEDESGGVGTLGYALLLAPRVRLYGEVGYQKFDELDGPEFLAGLAVQLAPNFGVFADYRSTQLELEDTDIEISYDELRTGVRFYF